MSAQPRDAGATIRPASSRSLAVVTTIASWLVAAALTLLLSVVPGVTTFVLVITFFAAQEISRRVIGRLTKSDHGGGEQATRSQVVAALVVMAIAAASTELSFRDASSEFTADLLVITGAGGVAYLLARMLPSTLEGQGHA